ncbi:MAG: hypothetical protein K0A90_00135 [Methanosarcinaceae archaeon]|nr:hypothetical protein [Methanosarcinaceae archaeon]
MFEDGLYWANVTIETKVSKASLPVLLKLALGARDDAVDYTVTSDPTIQSLSLKFFYQGTKIGLLNGLVVKDFDISASKDESISMTLNCIAKKMSKVTETLSVTTNTGTPMSWLDTSITIGEVPSVLNSFNLSGNWNVTDNEGRGIEAVGAGSRRLITTVLRHRLDINGSYEVEVNDTQEFGYTEDRADEAITVTMSRGTDNSHIFTLANTRSFARSMDMTMDTTKKAISYDYEALDVTVVGDL